MGALETVGEILEFAIEREISASEFYMEVAEQVEKAEVRELFRELAKVELEHKAALELELMKEGLVAKTDGRISAIEAGDYLVAGEVREDMDYKDVLVLGMQKEKASFRLYIDLSSLVEDGQQREILLEIAEEEARHKMQFEIEFDKISQSVSPFLSSLFSPSAASASVMFSSSV